MKETILVFDDEEDMLENMSRILERAGYRCVVSKNPSVLPRLLHEEEPDLVLTDFKMPQKNGFEILQDVKAVKPHVAVIVFTAYADVQSAVSAIKAGASDYVGKPFSSETLLLTIDKALREKRLKEENLKLRQKLGQLYGLDKVIGTSRRLRSVLEIVRKVAGVNANILITGDSGTGKELIARVLHMNSLRKDGPFVPVDCASLPEHLLESEIFGHEKGAFTDAHGQRPGFFEYAHGGTVFLDEIGDMPMNLQVKLLRVLQERHVRRLGSNRLIPVDIRIVAATNKDLKQAVERKIFREELYFRLNVIPIDLPLLKEREGDISLLAKHFFNHFAQANKKKIKGLSPATLAVLESYGWPGNVRELQNAIERAVALAEGEWIEPGDMPEAIRSRQR